MSLLLGESGSDVSSRLMVLQHKGLVDKVTCNKGKQGGSTWRLTPTAIDKLNLKRG